MIKRPDLEEIYRLYDSPKDRDAARNSWRRETRAAAAGDPLTGAYYWLPAPDKTGTDIVWQVQEFFDGWRPNSDHAYIWKHVADSLNHAWRRSVRGCDYCSLPRGRVCQMKPASKGFALYHGNDSPLGPESLEIVAALFNLAGRCRFAFDEHEQMIAGQPEALSEKLGVDLKLVGVEMPFLDEE